MSVVLASSSPRRRELLTRVGLPIEVRPPEVDERPQGGEEAIAHAARLAAAKADAVAAGAPGAWILAADTVVELDGRILGKAADATEARAMLEALAGRIHRVTTAFAIRGPGGASGDHCVTTAVSMRPLGAGEVAGYVASGEWRGKAGAYAVQGMAAAFVDRIDGSITNVIGLPLAEVLAALASLGGPAPDYARGVPA